MDDATVHAPASLTRRLAAEAAGTAFLLMTIIGSGIMGQRLSGGNDGLALLANSLATGCMLSVLILVFSPVSGAHFNPVVTLCMAAQKRISRREALLYIAVQSIAAIIGVAAAHLMFGEPLLFVSHKMRFGAGQWFSEGLATFGLIIVIFSCARNSAGALPLAVGAYITGAYWFTASTSFANPAVTVARAFSDTFAGIRPADAAPFIIAQLAGAVAGFAFAQWLIPAAAYTNNAKSALRR